MSGFQRAAANIRRWRENASAFVWDNFGVDPDPWQKEALQAASGPANPRRRIGMKACTGPGKSTVLSWLGWHRLVCFARKGEHPKGIALSGEGRDNLRDNLWAELSKWQQRSDFLKEAFVWTKEQIYASDHPETWFLSARSYPKDADAEAIGRTLAGTHSQFPFALLDEIGKMPIAVGQKVSQIFTGDVVDGLIAGAGNPTSVSGLLHHIATIEKMLWFLITITADPDDPRAFWKAPRFSADAGDHAREQIKLYGRDNPWVMSTILGLFPPSALNNLLSSDEVEAAMNRNYKMEDIAHMQKRLGIDVARFGDDRTVIFPRQGLVAFRPVEMRGVRTTDIAARVMHARTKWEKTGTQDILELVDDTGHWGHGVIDNLLTAGFSPLAIQFHAPALDPRYKNRRAEMWLKMADWVKRGGALPNVTELVAELVTPTYTFSNGQFLLEEKDQVKKRLLRSPDLADGLALTFAVPDRPAAMRLPGTGHTDGQVLTEYDSHDYDGSGGRGKVKTEYDPFDPSRS